MKTIILILSFIPAVAMSYDSYYATEDYISYENIVNELKADKPKESDLIKDYDEIFFHIGAGFSQSLLNINGRGKSDTITMSGVRIKGAVNLMSPYWLVEGAVNNYNTVSGNKATYKFREFEMQLTRFTPLTKQWFSRITTGLAARFLQSDLEERGAFKDYNTPALILGGGLGYNINSRMAIVSDLAFKVSMIDDTIDRSVFDFSVRLDTRF